MKKVLSIEDGFQIVMLFLQNYWLKHLKKAMIDKGMIFENFNNDSGLTEKRDKDTLHDRNWYFFAIVCDGTSSDYFEKVIEETMHILPIKQSGMPIKEEDLFQLMIDFCQFVNKRFSDTMVDSLKFAIASLEDMRKSPEKHQTEWKIWNDTVIDVTEHGARSSGLF